MERGWIPGPLPCTFSLRTLNYKELGRANAPPPPPQAVSHIHAVEMSRPAWAGWSGAQQCALYLGTINPLVSRRWVAWQLLSMGLGELAPSHTPTTGWRPATPKRAERPGNTHWARWQAAHIRCLLLTSPLVPGRQGTHWPFCRWKN